MFQHSDNSKTPRLRHVVAIRPKQPKDGIMLPAMLWDDAKCRKLVGAAFDNITYGPYKSDLCRLHVLWRHGGVYTDDDIWLMREPPQGLVVIRESALFKLNANQVHLFNAFISVPGPHHPAIKAAMRRSHAHIREAGIHEEDAKDLWGPRMLDMVMRKFPNKTVLQEECRVSPCDCHVPNLLYSHKPCHYRLLSQLPMNASINASMNVPRRYEYTEESLIG